MRGASARHLVFVGVLDAAALFCGIYDVLTGDPLGWPITICSLLLTCFLVFRIWLARCIRRSRADSVARGSAEAPGGTHLA